VFSAKELQAFQTILSEYHVIALPTEEAVEEPPDALIIINHQNFGHGISPE
jgi:hypothetical protein